jgi:DNA mismatch repair ATPase MutS
MFHLIPAALTFQLPLSLSLSLSPTAGIRLAELSLFPAPVITQARQLVNTINTRQAQRKQPSMEARREKLVRTLATTLMQVATNSKLDLPALRYIFFITLKEGR